MKDIKRRIKSVQSTMQITKAMELVASSKMRRAKERALSVRPYFNAMYETVARLASVTRDSDSVYTRRREVKNSLYIVIAGDRGLAGGYNSNVFKLAAAEMEGRNASVITIGKKAQEHYAKRQWPVAADYPGVAETMRISDTHPIVEDMLKLAEEKGEPPFLFLLDDIEDPHNLGAIIRTANLAGAHGVIIPKRRAVGLTATVARTSAGALNYTPVAKVTNLSATIEELKEKGMWFVCADMDGTTMYDLNLTGPIGLVIGNEGSGVGRLVKEKCDFVASIPMKGDIDSLNASVAAGVLAYEIVRQRMTK